MARNSCIIIFLFAVVSIFLASCLNVYEEGFNSIGILPGSPGDPRGMPNIPFSTDTNRLTDGFTSNAPVDITSPHFPMYYGSIADASLRYERYAKYAESAAVQGVALYGAGDAVKEDARVKITSKPNYEQIPAPSISFPVYAAIKWNPSDFAIQDGETYEVSVNGPQTGFSSQFWRDGNIRVNAEGYESYYDATSNCYVGLGRCRSYLRKKRRLEIANWMSLVCGIGQFVIPLQAIEPGKANLARYLPLDESALRETIFHVGQSVTFRAIYTGSLICFANDAHSEYWNNQGQLNVTVTRVSWPPKNTTYYQGLYLPACDSALAVYANYGYRDQNLTETELAALRMACNANGGGAGWTMENILSNSARYESGAPDFLKH